VARRGQGAIDTTKRENWVQRFLPWAAGALVLCSTTAQSLPGDCICAEKGTAWSDAALTAAEVQVGADVAGGDDEAGRALMRVEVGAGACTRRGRPGAVLSSTILNRFRYAATQGGRPARFAGRRSGGAATKQQRLMAVASATAARRTFGGEPAGGSMQVQAALLGRRPRLAGVAGAKAE
jgi:hypothetical protein